MTAEEREEMKSHASHSCFSFKPIRSRKATAKTSRTNAVYARTSRHHVLLPTHTRHQSPKSMYAEVPGVQLQSQNPTLRLPGLFPADALGIPTGRCAAFLRHSSLPALLFGPHRCVDCQLEYLAHALGLFGTAFNICGAHAICDSLSLLRRHWRQTLGAQQLDASTFCAKVGFETDED